MKYEMIDFHTHPYVDTANSICYYKDRCKMPSAQVKEYLTGLGITKICGSVLDNSVKAPKWSDIARMNDEAIAAKAFYGEFYELGFHVHAGFVDESLKEIERMEKLGAKLVGELIPYSHGWDYGAAGFEEILKALDEKDMVVSFHSTYGAPNCAGDIDRMVERHPKITFVAAHPGEKDSYMRHLERMKRFENYYLDLSGTGLFRFGMLAYGVSEMGSERFLFGSDFSVCDPSMYIASIATDPFLSEEEKRNIFSGNAKRILKL